MPRKIHSYNESPAANSDIWKNLHNTNAHSELNIQNLKIEYQAKELNKPKVPVPIGLPPETKIVYFGKDSRPHGIYILIIEINLESRIFYSSCLENFKEERYIFNLGPHQASQIFYLGNIQFIYFPDHPSKSKINGHHLHDYTPV